MNRNAVHCTAVADSFVPEGNHWINAAGAQSRNETGEARGNGENERRANERPWIVRIQSEELAADQTCQ